MIRRERRDGGVGEERGLRKGAERSSSKNTIFKQRIEIERKETKGN